MKILHLADTHLGYSAYRKVTEDGVNQREADVYKAFIKCIDYAIESKPDVVLHAGDLFDSVRPTNRAITTAFQQIIRLSREKIPFVVISGNHETPKLRETGSIFTIFEHLDYVYPVYKDRYETILLPQITIHAIPHCINFENNLKKIKLRESFNIFLAHGCVKGEFKMNEFNEQVIPENILDMGFDYIALGHYHRYSQIRQNAYYPGSTECLSFAEAGSKKGFIELEEGKASFIQIPTRSVVDGPSINCSRIGLQELMLRIKKTIREIEPQDKVFRITLENLPPHLYRGIDFSEIKELCKGCIHFEIRSNVGEGEYRVSGSQRIDSISIEFERFITDQGLPRDLLELGLEYIHKVGK